METAIAVFADKISKIKVFAEGVYLNTQVVIVKVESIRTVSTNVINKGLAVKVCCSYLDHTGIVFKFMSREAASTITVIWVEGLTDRINLIASI
jgi:hypothetical protein